MAERNGSEYGEDSGVGSDVEIPEATMSCNAVAMDASEESVDSEL